MSGRNFNFEKQSSDKMRSKVQCPRELFKNTDSLSEKLVKFWTKVLVLSLVQTQIKFLNARYRFANNSVSQYSGFCIIQAIRNSEIVSKHLPLFTIFPPSPCTSILIIA